MAETDAWMPLYVSDYLRDTQHLSTAEHGAYMLLILYAWGQDGRLTKDTERLRRVAKMTPKEWRVSWPVLREFFDEDGDGFRHGRIERERAKAADIVDKRREAGRAGAAKRWHSDAMANAMANASQTDGPSQSQVPLAKANGANAPSDKQFWDSAKAYLGKSKASKIGQWCRDYGQTETARAITAAQIERAVDPIPYIEKTLRRAKSDGLEMPVC